MRTLLTFEDVLLEPGYSDIKSRADIDLSREFLGYKFQLPIISANMDYVTEYEMAKAMLDAGAFYVLHRFYDSYQRYYDDVETLHWTQPVSISTGVDKRDNLNVVDYLTNYGIENMTVTVDVAHGHHSLVADMIKKLKAMGVPRIIAGNVATYEGYEFLADAGADAVKVGIGPGSVCTTRTVAGVGVPQISALLDISEHRSFSVPEAITGKMRHHKLGPPIILDGGMKNSGDIVKALAAGADMVMLGSLLAGTQEAPGERRTDTSGRVWKRYRGQSIFGVNASHYTPEGVDGWVEEKGSVKDVLQELSAGIRSGMSYVGARNLEELHLKARFNQITQAGYMIESAVRVQTDG